MYMYPISIVREPYSKRMAHYSMYSAIHTHIYIYKIIIYIYMYRKIQLGGLAHMQQELTHWCISHEMRWNKNEVRELLEICALSTKGGQ